MMSLRPLPPASIAIRYSGVALVLCAIWFGAWLLRGWFGLLGVTLVSIAFWVGLALRRRWSAVPPA